MKKQQVKKGKSLEGGEEPQKRKKEMHPEIKESLKLSDKGSLLDDFIFIFFCYLSKFSKLFHSDQSISIQGCYSELCNLLTLQISNDILSIFFNKLILL
jgi:hypothetical protein